MAASSSAKTCCLRDSSIPLVCESRRALAAAVPNAVLVEDSADTPDFTLVRLLQTVTGERGGVARESEKRNRNK